MKQDNNRYTFNELRNGPSYRWTDDHHSSITTGYMVDNLNTKTLEEAESSFEKLFVDVRNILTIQGAWCCDSEEDVLNASQTIARHVSKHLKFYLNNGKN